MALHPKRCHFHIRRRDNLKYHLPNINYPTRTSVVLGAVMVIALATGPKVRGFKPGR
jgi:hypothetical protein